MLIIAKFVARSGRRVWTF